MMIHAKSYTRGVKAEKWAAQWLHLHKSYTLLHHRWRCPYGELDLIMTHKSILRGIEVKFRPHLASGLWSIPLPQQKRLARSLMYYQAMNAPACPALALDVVIVLPSKTVYHYPNGIEFYTDNFLHHENVV